MIVKIPHTQAPTTTRANTTIEPLLPKGRDVPCAVAGTARPSGPSHSLRETEVSVAEHPVRGR
jgi:hypothetical protein